MKNREKWIVSHSFLLSKAKTVKEVYQAMLVKKILALACLGTSKKRKRIQKKQLAVNFNLDPTQWSETFCLAVDKHGVNYSIAS